MSLHEVPATTAQSLRRGALEELGKLSPTTKTEGWKKNAQRDAWRTLKRFGIGWKVKLDEFEYDTAKGEVLRIPYIAPKTILEYVMATSPELLTGGTSTGSECSTQLKAFWAAYQQQHPQHQIFETCRDCETDNETSTCVPLLLHGDEGRGKRRTGTLIVSLETPMGLEAQGRIKTSRKRKRDGQCCEVEQHHLDKFNQIVQRLDPQTLEGVVSKMRTNTKNNCFLHRWPLLVLPGVVYKAHPGIVNAFHNLLAFQLRALFWEGFLGSGGKTFTAAVIGLKGDMKWHTKVGCLTRSYENQGQVRDLPCCSECLGGTPGVPWECCEERPQWERTMFTIRPWSVGGPLLQIPFDNEAPERLYRKDPFHIGKVGILRDLVASCLFWCIGNGYYGRGNLPDLLAAAHGSFKLFCMAKGQSPSLRSFTKALFQYKSKKTYPWANTKGSDTVLLLKWMVVQLFAFKGNPLQADHFTMLDLMLKTASAAQRYYDHLYSHGLFLSRTCAISLYLDGRRFIVGYKLLAQKTLGRGCLFSLFAIKPKLHMWQHTLVDIRQTLERGATFVVSPLIYNCEGNEDAIGRLSRLSRRLDSRGVEGKVLQCFLVQAHLAHRRLKKTPK